jgi:hypothetical protein
MPRATIRRTPRRTLTRYIRERSVIGRHIRSGGSAIGRHYYRRQLATRRRVIRSYNFINGRYVPHIWNNVRRYLRR